MKLEMVFAGSLTLVLAITALVAVILFLSGMLKTRNKALAVLNRKQEALQVSEERNRTLVNAIPDLLFRYNREGICLDAVIKDETLLLAGAGDTCGQMNAVGKQVAEVLPASIAEMVLAGIVRALACGKVEILEYSCPLNGREHCFEARLVPIGKSEVVSIVRDISESKSREVELKYISMHDQLTGLYNRAFFQKELEHLDRAREHPVTVISADLDGLKLVNDTFGHAEGDRYLRVGAQILKSALRASDLPARIGGDEFALLLPNTSKKAAREVVKRINQKVAEHNRRRAGLPLGISIGFAVSRSSRQPLEETLKQADAAMYRDKFTRGKQARQEIASVIISTLGERVEPDRLTVDTIRSVSG